MEVLNIVENEDGSATLNLELTQEEILIFCREGLISVLKEAMEKVEKNESIHRTV